MKEEEKVTQSELQVTFEKASVMELKPGKKYIMILPKDAKIREIAAALSQFMADTKVFLLAVNNVSDIKFAEIEEDNSDTGVPQHG